MSALQQCEESGPGNDCALREQGANTTETYFPNDTAGRARRQQAKRAIVTLAIWGLLSASFASWLLLRLGLVAE